MLLQTCAMFSLMSTIRGQTTCTHVRDFFKSQGCCENDSIDVAGCPSGCHADPEQLALLCSKLRIAANESVADVAIFENEDSCYYEHRGLSFCYKYWNEYMTPCASRRARADTQASANFVKSPIDMEPWLDTPGKGSWLGNYVAASVDAVHHHVERCGYINENECRVKANAICHHFGPVDPNNLCGGTLSCENGSWEPVDVLPDKPRFFPDNLCDVEWNCPARRPYMCRANP